MYISSLPIINYPYYETNKKIVFKQATNITTRVKISEYVRKYRTNFTDYTILDAERPDTLSNRLYDSPKYDWILFLVNDIINPYYSWPMSSHDLNLYIKEKYKTSSFFVPDLWKRKNSYSVAYKKLEELSNENLFDSSFFQEKNVNSNFFYSINSNTPVKVIVGNQIFSTKIVETKPLYYEIRLDRKSWDINSSESNRYFIFEVQIYGEYVCVKVPITRIVDDSRYSVSYFSVNSEKREPSSVFSSVEYDEDTAYQFFTAPLSENKYDYTNFMNPLKQTFADIYSQKGSDGQYLDSQYFVTNEYNELSINENNRKILLPKPQVVEAVSQKISSLF